MLSNQLLKIAICDDEKTYLEQIAEMTKNILNKEELFHSITTYDSCKELLQNIESGAEYHILLLDIMMDELDGMKFARILREKKIKSSIIFISSNREMALMGYEVSAVRYLQKPLIEEKLEEALRYCFEQWQKKEEILLTTDYGRYRVALEDIQYVEAFDRGTQIVLEQDVIDVKMKFRDIMGMLPETLFVQSHRAYIVNLSHVKKIRMNEFEMDCGRKVPISKYRYNEVSKQFFDYLQ